MVAKNPSENRRLLTVRSRQTDMNNSLEEKLASPLPVENTGKPLPQRMNNRHSEIPPTDRDVRSKPPAYTARANTTRWQINYDNMNWDVKQHFIHAATNWKTTDSTRTVFHK